MLSGTPGMDQVPLRDPEVAILDACDAGSGVPVTNKATLLGVPAGRYPTTGTTFARAVLLCRLVDEASGASLVRVLRVVPSGGTAVDTVLQGAAVTALAVGDANADGAGPDIVAAVEPGSVRVYSTDSGGAWVLVANVATGATGLIATALLALVDLSGDGR